MRKSSICWILPLLALLAAPRIEAAHHQADLSPWTRGVIRELDMEGGFFGIFTEGGEKLLPMHLPEKFKQNGLAVRFRYRELTHVVSIRMWGKSVVIREIEEITGSDEESSPKP